MLESKGLVETQVALHQKQVLLCGHNFPFPDCLTGIPIF